MVKSSYKDDDVIILLKDITGMVEPQKTEEREKLIQSGRHYSEMLPIEYMPTQEYMKIYKEALTNYSKPTALAVGVLADKIMVTRKKFVIVSLARAGIPIGILLKRYLLSKYNINIKHYTISIIRDKGIDKNAMKFLLERHKPEELLFVDGWSGKGAIYKELKKALLKYSNVSDEIAVLADPANITDLCGTHEDILIPSSCLNCTVSGLISRTFYRSDIIGENDFHGAIYYDNLKNADLSYDFINAIEKEFDFNYKTTEEPPKGKGIDEAIEIALKFHIDNINFIKPGIGETTRVLLRRIPWKILINEKNKNDFQLEGIKRLAKERNVKVLYYPLKFYKACGLIKKVEDV